LLQIFDAYVIRGVAYQWFVYYLTKQLVDIEWLDVTTNEIQQKQQKEKKLSYMGSLRVFFLGLLFLLYVNGLGTNISNDIGIKLTLC
jgi:hypothetical protein